MGTSEFTAGGNKGSKGPASHIEGHGILLVTSCYRNQDKLQPDGPLGLYTDLPKSKGVFWLGIMVLTQISHSRFKKSKISMLVSHIYMYVSGLFVNFLVIFGYNWG